MQFCRFKQGAFRAITAAEKCARGLSLGSNANRTGRVCFFFSLTLLISNYLGLSQRKLPYGIQYFKEGSPHKESFAI
jgi:hypothetical protein